MKASSLPQNHREYVNKELQKFIFKLLLAKIQSHREQNSKASLKPSLSAKLPGWTQEPERVLGGSDSWKMGGSPV